VDAQRVEQLIQAGEALEREFKGESHRPLSDAPIYEDIVAMANADGGVLLIGVEDDGTITGARPRHGATTDCLRLQAAIFSNTVPHVNTRVSVVELPEGTVIAIEVDRYPEVCATTSGKCLRRAIGGRGEPQAVPYYPHEQLSRRSDLGLVDLSANLVSGASWRDLDPLQFERLRQTIPRLRGDRGLLELGDAEIAKALKLVETVDQDLVPNYAGLLLLGREEALSSALPTHGVRFQVLDARGDVRTNESFGGPLILIAEELEARFRARNQEREVLVGMIRLPVPDYAFDSFREAVLNALLHRQYAELQPIYVQWHPDQILITSPGGFPEGITVDNILTHEPKPRNPRLAEASTRIGLMEQTARGVDRIFLGQLRYGRPAPDYSRSDNTGVRLVLRGGKGSLEFAAFVHEQDKSQHPLTLDEMLVLNALLQERRLDSSSVARLIQKGLPEARSVLERLVERGLLEGVGERRGRAYHLAAKLYRQLGSAAAYVHAHGIDPLRQEAMVLEFVRAHGRVTRSDVMGLCGLTGSQARSLLQRLRSKCPQLKLVGEKRGAHYVWEEGIGC
jgi:ATP-dependent DNA helicase RecG